jgi:hypothetical protein
MEKVDREALPIIVRHTVETRPAAARVKAKRKAGKHHIAGAGKMVGKRRDRCGSMTAHWYTAKNGHRRYKCR